MNGNATWRRRWLLAGVLGLVATAGCHTMRPIPASDLVGTAVDRVWVTGTDQTTLVLHAPRLAGDTLGGFVDGTYREMLLSETHSIRRLSPARTRTAVLGATIGATALATFIYLANRNYVGDGQTCYIARDGQVVPCCAGRSTLAC